MAERDPTVTPQVITGTTLRSGDPNTGQFQYTQGGGRTHTVHSGTAGGDANIHVGAGRLDAALTFDSALQTASGQPIVFYDSALAVSGGPFQASGHKIVGILKHPLANDINMVNSGIDLHKPQYYELGYAFTSGLCHTGASGQVGFTISYTTVVSG